MDVGLGIGVGTSVGEGVSAGIGVGTGVAVGKDISGVGGIGVFGSRVALCPPQAVPATINAMRIPQTT